jgi:hypothetical protein
VLRCNHRLDDVCQIVDVGEGFDAEENVVECSLLVGSIFGALDDF